MGANPPFMPSLRFSSSLFLGVLLLAAGLARGDDLALPAPRGTEYEINRILAARRDATAFSTTGLPQQAVSDLLWASTGINRPTSGHRTSNYSYRSRDDVIYVLCAQGVFIYDQLEHILTQRSTTDLRPLLDPAAAAAPVTFAIASYNSSPNFFGSIHTGFISENIALACADRGLASRVTAAIPPALPTALGLPAPAGLPANQTLLVLHSVGYPEGATAADPAWLVAAGVLPPAAVNTAPALQILKRRRSTQSFVTTEFSPQTLADLLWAGVGRNNPATDERTAPATSGAQAIDIYVARSGGVYRYAPGLGAAHKLVHVSVTDVRGTLGFGSVPAIILYVADYTKLTGTTAAKQRAASLHAGHVSQNVAAYAAAEEIGEYVRSSVSNVSATLGLTADQPILFTQTLGYPSPPPGASTITATATAGGTITGTRPQTIAFGAAGTPLTATAATGYHFSHWSGLPGGRVPTATLELPNVTCAMNISAVFVADPTSFTAWRAINFTGADQTDDAVSGPLADPDAAGVTNLQRYAHGLPARGVVPPPVTQTTSTIAGGTYLSLAFDRHPTATDLTYSVEASADLATWETLETYPAGTPVRVELPQAARMSDPLTPRRFLRVRVTQSP